MLKPETAKKIEKAIMAGAKTYAQIQEATGCSKGTIAEYKKSNQAIREIEPPVSAPKPRGEPMGDIVFFGLDDRKGHYNQETGALEQSIDSRVTSEYPGWSQHGQIENLKDDITREKEQIRLGIVDKVYLESMKDSVKRKEAKLERILASKPVLKGGDKDSLKRTYDALGNEIRDAQFSKNQMDSSRTDAQEEADRMSENKMSLNSIPGMTPDLAKSLNLQVSSDGKTTRTQMEKAWKTIGGLIEEATNVESLRRTAQTVRR